LYGGGKNEPPAWHLAAAAEALKKITPLDAQGKPAADGKIVFISLGMSGVIGSGEWDSVPELSPALIGAKDPQVSDGIGVLWEPGCSGLFKAGLQNMAMAGFDESGADGQLQP